MKRDFLPFSSSYLIGSLSLAILFLTCSAGQSLAVLVNYQFNDSSLSPTSIDPNVSASDVNFTGSNATRFTFPNVLAVNAASGAINQLTAVSNNSFFAFTITPSISMNLTSLTFNGATATTPIPSNGYVVRSSVDTFGSDLASGSFPTQYPTFSSFSIDLTAPSFQGLTTPVTFRAYTFLDSNAGNPAAVYDNVTLSGTATPVPLETDALPLVFSGLFFGGGVWLKRKRSQAKVSEFIANKGEM